MPFMDGTGPIGGGSFRGSQQGRCSGAGALAGRRNGRGHRNMFFATGRTGRQRAAQESASAAEAAGELRGPLARLEDRLSEVIERPERFEPSEQD